MNFQLEVIAFNLDCCNKIEEAGAQRIELCANPADGGTTPSHGLILQARKNISIEMFPMIRPRGGDFVFNDGEFEICKSDVAFCRDAGCDGVVIGILLPDGKIDVKRCKVLVNLAYPMSVTFHRAFDRVADPLRSLEEVIDIGCQRLLTSGLRTTASEGINMLNTLVQRAGNHISIMPGSGIRADNIMEIAAKTGADEFHTSARMSTGSRSTYQNKYLQDNFTRIEVDQEQVQEMINLLHEKPVE